MGIQYVFSAPEDHIYPRIACDVCCKPISLAIGNVVWEAPPDSWHGDSELIIDRIWFTHKECDHILRWKLQQEGIHTFWEELRLFPIHLMYNNGMQPAAMAAWDMRNPDRTRDTTQHSGLSLRFFVLKRDKYRCQLCGRSAKDGVTLEIDHKVARAKGGTDVPANLWTLCFDCNRGKSDENL